MYRFKKLLYKINFDLNKIYGKYNRLTTQEGRNRFFQIVYSICVCAVTLMFLWYYGIGLNLEKSANEAQSVKYTNQLTSDKVPENKNSTVSSPQQDVAAAKDTGSVKTSENTQKKQKVASKTTPKAGSNQKQVNKSADKPIKKAINKGPNTSMVSVTFDDGYNKKDIEKVLDILKRNGVKSTFFIIGKVLDDYPDVWKRAINDGHQICNHTNNHEDLTNLSDKLVRAEILGWEDSARKALGDAYVTKMKKEFPYLRLPGGGGAKSNRILAIAQENGYTVIGWNLETYSSIIKRYRKTLSVQEISKKIEQHVVNRCSKGSIILLHFNQYDTGNIEEIIQGIKKRGFDMQPVSKLIK